jgi:glycine/sarcosine N-methyltransferase
MSSADNRIREFYDGFAPDYELAYAGDWERVVDRQGAALDLLIQRSIPGARDVLDCSCGIGTQAIGLAQRGYRVRGTDISEGALARARAEAERMGVAVPFSVADFRDLSRVEGVFDVVISCDNAIPHLLDEEDGRSALQEMRAKLRLGGLLIITMRDFDAAFIDKPPIAPPVIVDGQPRRVLVRLHDWDTDLPRYTLRYLVLTEANNGWTVVEYTAFYRAITRVELADAARAAGFGRISWSEEEVVGGQQVMTGYNDAR